MKQNPVYIDKIKTYYFRNLSNSLTYKYHLPLPLEMPFRIKEEIKKFNVIHLHGYRHSLNILIHYYAQKYQVPYIFQAHGSLPKWSAKRTLKVLYDQLFGYRLFKNASKVIALGQVEFMQYRNMGLHEKKNEIIPNGIDLSGYSDLPFKGIFKEKFCIDKNEQIVLYLGRLHKSKGLEFIIKSFTKLIQKLDYKGVRLVIAGSDDGFMSRAKHLVNSSGISEKVLFTDLLTEREKKSALVDANFLVYVAPQEPFGIVSLEAAASNTPVIVAQGTEMSEIISNANFGFSTEYNNISELVKLMTKFLTINQLSKKMGENGRRFVFKNLGWSSIVPKFEKVYESAINNSTNDCFMHQ